MKHQEINRMKLEFDAISENEAFARQTRSVFAAALDPTVEEISDLRLVISEAVTNCVVHAYKGTRGKVTIEAALYEDRRLKVKIKDKGCGIADLDACRQPLYTTCPDGERGGMGFTIMSSFTDKMKIRSVLNKGTTVTLEKRLHKNVTRG